MLALLFPEKIDRPSTRAECLEGIRPCPYVGCRYHLYLDVVSEGKAIKFNFPWLEPWELPYSCALDLADAAALVDGMTLESVGSALNVTKERLRQVEYKALRRLLPAMELQELASMDMCQTVWGFSPVVPDIFDEEALHASGR